MIHLYICDDHNIVLEGLITILSTEEGFSISGSALNGESCLRAIALHPVDVLLTDISMPGMDGIELCRQVKTAYPHIQILALSTYNQGKFIVSMLEAGASGYLLKNAERHEIVHAIKTVAEGKEYLGFELSKIYHAAKEKSEQKPILTKREKEILKLIYSGQTNAQISALLFISMDTVDTHRKNIYTKLNVNNIASLVKYVSENDNLL
ncbi:MAG TPA: response regulator transcription factor [Chitinophagaceae bacterium]|nr:response regulator transcription factor [Chitinophagaceae bacterium]